MLAMNTAGDKSTPSQYDIKHHRWYLFNSFELLNITNGQAYKIKCH